MKTLLKSKIILLLGIVALWGCEEDVTPLRHTAPQVTFPVQETSLTAVVGDPVEVPGRYRERRQTHLRMVCRRDARSLDPGMTYTFSAPGDYEVRFEARNGAGKVERS